VAASDAGTVWMDYRKLNFIKIWICCLDMIPVADKNLLPFRFHLQIGLLNWLVRATTGTGAGARGGKR